MAQEKICPRCNKVFTAYFYETHCTDCNREIDLERKQAAIRGESDDDINTWSDDYVICPYCGAVNGDRWTPHCDMAELYEEGDHEIECWECGKKFLMFTDVSYSWETKKAGV